MRIFEIGWLFGSLATAGILIYRVAYVNGIALANLWILLFVIMTFVISRFVRRKRKLFETYENQRKNG